MYLKKRIFLIAFAISMMNSCYTQEDAGPGYRWALFKDSPVWILAQAVQHEDTARIYDIVKSGTANINFREPKFGQTLLMLAIGNNKLNSVLALLKSGADVRVENLSGDQAIHEACKFPELRNHSAQIIELLIKYGANVNSRSENGMNTVPLEGVVSSLACSKILLAHGADPYYINRNDTVYRSYDVWVSLLSSPLDSNIYVAKYMIVDKKMAVPNPITFSLKHRPLDILYFLSKPRFDRDAGVKRIKDEIVGYLQKIGFPEHGAYSD